MNNLIILIFEWASSIISLSGAFLIASNGGLNWWGHLISVISNILGIVVMIKIKRWGFLLNMIIFMFINIIGLIQWWSAN
jgi:hypothetical protein